MLRCPPLCLPCSIVAGTDADILITIVGDRGRSSRKPLVDPEGVRDLFERGQVGWPSEHYICVSDVGMVRHKEDTFELCACHVLEIVALRSSLYVQPSTLLIKAAGHPLPIPPCSLRQQAML